MALRRGDVVSHSGAIAWGVGKVVDVAANKVSIQFNDGVIRKIACSHFGSLLPAEPALFLQVPEAGPSAPPKKVPVKRAPAKKALASPKQDKQSTLA